MTSHLIADLSKPARWVTLAVVLAGAALLFQSWEPHLSRAQPAPFFSIPIRWCAVQGAPADTTPGNVNEPDTDNVLWRRHERTSEATYIPQAGVTLRSSLANIVVAQNLNFPVIADPDLTVGQPGDILSPVIDATEWNTIYNACVTAWQNVLGIGDIGIVAINARKIVDVTGGEAAFAMGWLAGRRVLLEDNAWSLPTSAIRTSIVADAVDKTLGHEVGHTLPTPTIPVGSSFGGLRHTCLNTNMMRQGRQDTDGDNRLDNFRLSTSIGQGNLCAQVVDQIAEIRGAAPMVPGCMITGTNTPCSSISDVRTDAVADVGDPFLDISMLFVTLPDPGTKTEFAHELFGPISSAAFGTFSGLEYFVLADLDNDASTGGAPASLGIPTTFEGAELVTRVTVVFLPTPLLLTVPTVWKFEGGGFVQVSDPSISSRIDERVAVIHDSEETIESHTSDAVVIEMSNDIRGPADTFPRVQAITRGLPVLDDPQVIDYLLDEGPADAGVQFNLQSPTFPICTVMPDPAPAGGSAIVEGNGLLPNAGVHVLFGPDEVADGSTDVDGAFAIGFDVPANASAGPHLVTVGNVGTALTADCIVQVPALGGGGIAEAIVLGSDSAADKPGSSSARDYTAPIAAAVVAGAFALAAGGWYARRRWLR